MVASIGSVASSEKFVHFSHPAEVVLSLINKTQSPGWRRFAIISIHGVMIEAMNLRRLLDSWKRCCSWSSSVHAKHLCEKPPSSKGQELDL
jgi:hypothetical protein